MKYIYFIYTATFLINCMSEEFEIGCKPYKEKFKIGLENYDNNWKSNIYRAKNGYVADLTEPFALIFRNRPLSRNAENDISNINNVLGALQYTTDVFRKEFLQEWPSNSTKKKFFDKNSECIENDMKCARTDQEFNCDLEYKYRSIDGTCNNLHNSRLGSTITPYSRLLDAYYSDDIQEIRKDSKGNDLASPRIIVNEVLSKKYFAYESKRSQTLNMGWYLFGQLITHDVSGIFNRPNGAGNSNPSRCCSGDYKQFLPHNLLQENCLPFKILHDDDFFKKFNYYCHNYIRSQPIFPNDCKLRPAQQLLRVTHFLDLSIIYGLSKDENENVRTLENGLLKTSANNELPKKDDGCEGALCYFTGDYRVTQTPSLGMMHSYFIKLHNKIAHGLKKLNRNWNDEKLFQESRRINIAIYQHIIYNDYLPFTLGRYSPPYDVEYDGDYGGDYDMFTDPSTFNEFATAIFRNLHTLMPSHFQYYDKNLKISANKPVSELILTTTDYFQTMSDDITRGFIYQEINYGKLEDEIKNKLFNNSDLISIDIQRGRDHGLPPYYMVRTLCNSKPIDKWNDLYPWISKKNIGLLKKMYSSPMDIDLYIGSYLEERAGIMGPTSHCIMRKQFTNFKLSDRFFYTHKNQTNSFTDKQLNAIMNISFSKLLCLVTGVDSVPTNAFMTPNSDNILIDCSNIEELNLFPWISN